MNSNEYSIGCTLPCSITEATEQVIGALRDEGFGIISTIDIAEKFKEKLGIDHEPHLILGACNPKLAHQAISDNPDVALALPCNVVLREVQGSTSVTALLPSVALQPFAGLKVQESSCTAEEALKRVFSSLSPTSS